MTEVPAVTRAEMAEVDRIMIEELGITLVQMMENAGRHLARLAVERYEPSSVMVLSGRGGNGGGGMVAARHLANWGVEVVVVVTETDLDGVPAWQRSILGAMGVRVDSDPADADLVIDALIGYGLRGAPRGRTRELIEWTADRTVLALDIPSGVDADTGRTPGVAVDADATLALALPKVGARRSLNTGELFLADISVPPAVFARLGKTVDPRLFRAASVVPA